MLRALAQSARVSNLPTVWTNVMVGACLGGWTTSPGPLLVALASATLLYTGGMLLNDVVDAPWDRLHKPDRPIAAGRLAARLAASLALAALFGGVAMAATAGQTAAGWAGAILASIVLYNALHKQTAVAVVFMAACRGLLYPLAAAIAGGPATDLPAWPASAAVAAYTLLITLAARREDRPGATVSRVLAWLVPLPFFAAASAYFAERLLWTAFAAAAFFAWTAMAARDALRAQIRSAVQGWLAGLCLADALMLCLVNRPDLAGLALLAWLATAVAHRLIAGT